MRSNRPSLDWNAVRQRLTQAQEALDRALDPDASHTEAVWAERAVQMSRRVPHARTSSRMGYAVFTLGHERYALPLNDLGEVLAAPRWTRVPGAPATILGAMTVRGEIRLVADVAALLSLSTYGAAREHVLLVRRPEVGLAVDRVHNLVQWTPEQLVPADDTRSRFVRYLAPEGVQVLSLEALLGHPTLSGDSP